MIHLNQQNYAYFEEINEGIIRQFKNLPKGLTTLDVGCGYGALGEQIQNLGFTVWGIERSRVAMEKCKGRIAHSIEADILSEAEVSHAIADQRVDVIIFSDVLEHLYDPFSILKNYSKYLKPGGRLLISLPNALNWEMRIRLFFGSFEYQDTGALDRTHLRFFTFRTARRLVEAAGFKVNRIDCTPYLIRAILPIIKKTVFKNDGGARAIIDSPSYRFYAKFIYPIERLIASIWKPLLGERIIINATRIEN